MSTSTIIHQQNIIAEENLRQNKWWQKSFTMAGQAILALIVGIVLLEGYFRLAGVGEQEFVQPDLTMGCRHIPGKKVIWRMEGYSSDKLSSVGLRDSEHVIAKPVGTYRIALLGDSAVESMQVSMGKTFGKVLEKLLNAQLAKKYARV